MRSGSFPEKTEKSPGKRMQSGNRRRRVRCKTCEACLGGDCKQCVYCKGKFIIFEVFTKKYLKWFDEKKRAHKSTSGAHAFQLPARTQISWFFSSKHSAECVLSFYWLYFIFKDMTKYGGPGRMKQTCEKRRCLHPQLPVCAHCSICNLDGWFNTPKVQGKEAERPEEPPNLCKSDSSYNLYFSKPYRYWYGSCFVKVRLIICFKRLGGKTRIILSDVNKTFSVPNVIFLQAPEFSG